MPRSITPNRATAVLVEITQRVAPNNPCSTLVLGAVQVTLNMKRYYYHILFVLPIKTVQAMLVSADARTQTFNALKTLKRCS